jgi:hypothetical protein
MLVGGGIVQITAHHGVTESQMDKRLNKRRRKEKGKRRECADKGEDVK